MTTRRTFDFALTMLLAGSVACSVGEPLDADDPYWDDHQHDETRGDTGAFDEFSTFAVGQSIEETANNNCTTASARWLSEQLIDEINCMQPGTMARIDDIPGIQLSSGAFPWLQAPAADALRNAVNSRGGTLRLNSSLRTTVQQFMLYYWYRNRLCTHVVGIAAPPGRSNHESGLAVDTSDYNAWMSTLNSSGFSWLGSFDPVHFDYVGSGAIDVRSMSVRAFQRLWNRNNPNEQISEDGAWGPQTEGAMRRSPATGFDIGASCQDPATPAPEHAIEVYWSRNADASYDLRALAPTEITRVEYQVDGFLIAEATRADGDNFAQSYLFSQESNERLFEVLGYNDADELVGRGIGLIDVTADVAVYIKQMGDSLYEVGLERAPAGVAAVEVKVDGYLLTDLESGQSRSERNAVRYRYNTLGERNFVITTFNADGSERGNLYRTFTLE